MTTENNTTVTTDNTDTKTSTDTNGLGTSTRREVEISWHEEEKAFRSFLDDNMSGQEDVKDALVDILAAIRNPLRDPNTPIFSVLMCGPSTSGKTLGFKLLVQWVHGDREKMMFFSGSDFEERHQIQKLIGAPHGYTGYVDVHDPKYKAPQPGEPDDSALLAQHNLNNAKLGCKNDVIFMLFDEWEKFHFAFNRFMLRPLREGTGQMNNGQDVSFRNVVMGFTSNLGSEEIEKLEKPFGFKIREAKVITKQDVRQVVVRELIKGYPPEFRNRINRVLYFAGLDNSQLLRVVDLELGIVQNRIMTLGVNAFVLSVDESAKLWLLKRDGDSEEKSPLPGMQQKLNLHLVGPLGRLVRNGVLHSGDRIEVTHKEGEDKLTFYVTADPLAHLASKVDVSDTPEISPAKVDGGNDATGAADGGSTTNTAGPTADPTNGGKKTPATALVLVIGGKADGGATSNGDSAPADTGIEVRYPQPFRLIMRSSPEKLEATSAAVRAAADRLKGTIVAEYTNNMTNGLGTAEVYSVMEDMVALRSMFPGLRVVAIGFELGGE